LELHAVTFLTCVCPKLAALGRACCSGKCRGLRTDGRRSSRRGRSPPRRPRPSRGWGTNRKKHATAGRPLRGSHRPSDIRVAELRVRLQSASDLQAQGSSAGWLGVPGRASPSVGSRSLVRRAAAAGSPVTSQRASATLRLLTPSRSCAAHQQTAVADTVRRSTPLECHGLY